MSAAQNTNSNTNSEQPARQTGDAPSSTTPSLKGMKKAVNDNKERRQREGDAAFNARRVSNYASTLAPLITGVIKEPGLGVDQGEASRAVGQLSSILQETVSLVIKHLDMDPTEKWVHKVLARPLAQICSEAWVYYKGDAEKLNPQRMSHVFAEFIKAQLPSEDRPDFSLFSSARECALAEASAMSRLAASLMWVGSLPEGVRKLMISAPQVPAFSHHLFARVRKSAMQMTELLTDGADAETKRRINMQMLRDISRVAASAVDASSRRLAREIRAIAASGDAGAKNAFRQRGQQAGDDGLLGQAVYREIDAYTESVGGVLKNVVREIKEAEESAATHSVQKTTQGDDCNSEAGKARNDGQAPGEQQTRHLDSQ